MRTVFIIAATLEMAMKTAKALDLAHHRWTYLGHAEQLEGHVHPIVIAGPGANRRKDWDVLSHAAVQAEATVLMLLQLNGDHW